MRRLEMCEPIARECDQLGLSGACAGLQHHVGERRLAPFLVWQTDDRRLLDGGVAQQDTFDLEARDVLSPADDYVLDPIADLDLAVPVQDSGDAGVEPTVAHDLL